MRRVSIITAILALFLISSVSAGVSKMATSKPTLNDERIVVPIELENSREMSALDLPLKFSEGATLEEVLFEGTRAENFDFATALIDNKNHTVVIGMIPMVYGEKEDLAPGKGEVARLVFRVDSPDLQVLEITTTTIASPEHTPMFVYSDGERGQAELIAEDPGFEPIRIALAQIPDSPADNLPTVFSLSQNYPNPFNPSTDIAFTLPAASRVKIDILNVLGQQVRTLKDEYTEAGAYTITWDGRDQAGSSVASGVYFYRMKAGNQFEEVKKMMMLK